MHVSFTPKALAKARDEVAALADPSAGVLITPNGSGTDVKRGARGEVVWISRPWAAWRAWCLPLAEWPSELERVEVNGITVVLLDAPGSNRAFRLTLKRGKLHAAIDA